MRKSRVRRFCSPGLLVIGLTGSIAMGKSTLAAQCRALGVPVLDSDAVVHQLLGPHGQGVRPVGDAFPEAYLGDRIDRAVLGRLVFGDDARLQRLESLLHPLVRRAQERFLRQARAKGHRLAVLDIPLLYETGADARCDYVILATAPAFLQRQRALKRPHMTPERLAYILARQMPDAQKRQHADRIVQTGLGKKYSLGRLQRFLALRLCHANVT